MDDVSVTEPYQIYTAPWNDEIVLMDDTGFDKLQLLEDAEFGFADDIHILFTNYLLDGAAAHIYVDGYDHCLDVTVKHRMTD